MTAASGDPAQNPEAGGDSAGDQPVSGAYEAPPIEQIPAYGGHPEAPQAPLDYPAGYPAYPPPAYPPPGYPRPGYPPPAYPPPEHVAPYPGGYGFPAVPQGTNPLAIFSLVASVAGLLCGLGSVIGIVLGVVAMNQTKRSGQDGYGLAVAGLVVGVATLVVGLIWMTYAISQP